MNIFVFAVLCFWFFTSAYELARSGTWSVYKVVVRSIMFAFTGHAAILIGLEIWG